VGGHEVQQADRGRPGGAQKKLSDPVERLKHTLALELGKSLEEIDRLSSSELSRWAVYFGRFPTTARRLDFDLAQIAREVRQVRDALARQRSRLRIKDFLLWDESGATRLRDPAAQEAYFHALALAMGAKGT